MARLELLILSVVLKYYKHDSPDLKVDDQSSSEIIISITLGELVLLIMSHNTMRQL